jgi:hypothetical protein
MTVFTAGGGTMGECLAGGDMRLEDGPHGAEVGVARWSNLDVSHC